MTTTSTALDLAFAATLSLTLACSNADEQSLEATRGASGAQDEVAFVSDRSGNYDVFMLDIESGEVTNLTDHEAMEFGYSWSPDGTRIAFMSDRDGNEEIYSMVVPDGPVVRLTDHEARDGAPSWSPDGTRIAFISRRNSNSAEIYVMQSDGSDLRRVTTNDRYEEVPSFSPDGRHLAFGAVAMGAEAEPTLQIFRLDLTTGEETQLTRLAGHNSAPRWSPDGSEIAFYGEVGEGFVGAKIMVMSADGRELRRLTDDAEPDWQPDWSPDGSTIVFARGPGDPLDLWVVDRSGGESRLLHAFEGRDEQPKWRPPPPR